MFTSHHSVWPKNLALNLDFPETSLYYNLQVSATRYPRKTAIIYYGRQISYAELKQQVDALAGFLQQKLDVARGERVLLDMQNSPQFIIAYYAILRADAMVVPVNPMNLTAELHHYIEDAQTRVAICGEEVYACMSPLLGAGLEHAIVATYSDYIDPACTVALPEVLQAPRATIHHAQTTRWRDALGAQCVPRPHLAGADDLCVMPYTSGTTGKPKGCTHTHATVMSTVVIGSAWFGGTPESVVLATLPYFHVTGMQGSMNTPIFNGATVVLMTRWDRDTAARLIQDHGVTSWTNISTMAIDFLANPGLDRYDLSSLRRIGGGGAAMPEAVAQRLNDLTGLDYIEGYGQTETIAPTHINPPERPKKQCLGIPVNNTDARVIDPETLRELGAGEIGEIVSCGPQIFKGYWNNPEANQACFIEIDGKRFFRTGDLGRYDEEGYFFIVDRLKRMINAAGFKVWPAEVEAIMYHHPDIQEACVIAARDRNRGETVKVIVVPKASSKNSLSAEQVIDWCRANMAAYKVPRLVDFAETLPKSATGKVQWRLLQEKEMAASNDT